MGKMIVLVGESGSGKTTIQKELGKLGTKKVVTSLKSYKLYSKPLVP